jgi:predicted transcriptional regulator
MEITLPKDSAKDSAIFSQLTVKDTMRCCALSLLTTNSIATAIQTLIKHKSDSLLIEDDAGFPEGVITKTEIMGAYYADLPLSTQLGDIMGTPVIHCTPDDTLRSALVTMQQYAIHRLYVVDSTSKAVGTLSYPDIVGTLYKYCCSCEFGLRQRKAAGSTDIVRYTVKDVMTKSIVAVQEDTSIQEIIEQLSSFKLGALMVQSTDGSPLGVISKSDIALAYKRKLLLNDTATKIYNKPIISCSEAATLEEAIRQMIFSEVSRLFIYAESPKEMSGVLSLSDTARLRSGSCQACSSSRIEVKKDYSPGFS